ncbi:lytic murein transglycosylase B [Marinomonas epiphytica]
MKQLIWVALAVSLSACTSAAIDQTSTPIHEGVSKTLLKDKPATKAASYGANPEVQAFIDMMVEEYQYDEQQLQTAFSLIKVRPKVIQKSNNQPEQITPYYEYKTRFVSQDRAQAGVKFAQQHGAWLQKAEQEFGVDANVIVALMGVETFYGRITGSRDVFTSLTTLAFDYPRRKTFFQSELKAYLLLVREQGWEIGQTKGSYSGAMGMTQFMPSNYRSLAIDYDQDGEVDLWRSAADAIGSIANYLQHHGWQTGKPAYINAMIKGDIKSLKDKINHGRAPLFSVSDWSHYHVLPTQTFENDAAGLLSLRTAEDEVSYWLAYENFFTVMDYNPSRRYAMSVFELSEKIKNHAQN